MRGSHLKEAQKPMTQAESTQSGRFVVLNIEIIGHFPQPTRKEQDFTLHAEINRDSLNQPAPWKLATRGLRSCS